MRVPRVEYLIRTYGLSLRLWSSDGLASFFFESGFELREAKSAPVATPRTLRGMRGERRPELLEQILNRSCRRRTDRAEVGSFGKRGTGFARDSVSRRPPAAARNPPRRGAGSGVYALSTPDAILESIASLIANPVAAGEVRYAKDWPRAQTLP